MEKIADRYYQTDPWKIIEQGFDPNYGRVSESIFSLGNEYMGVRGYFEEGYSGEHLQGSYQNGVYERKTVSSEGYKGIVRDMEFMVNSVDDLYLRLKAGEEVLDLHKSRFADFRRTLDLKTGLLERSFLWKTEQGDLRIQFFRILSMTSPELGIQKLVITSEGYTGPVLVSSGLSFHTFHGDGQKCWNLRNKEVNTEPGEDILRISAETKTTKIDVEAIARQTVTGTKGEFLPGSIQDEKPDAETASLVYEYQMDSGNQMVLEKNYLNLTLLAGEKVRKDPEQALRSTNFSEILSKNEKWWKEVWNKSDIEIMGDDENQQGIRFCIFQMFQTYHGARRGTNIGAKGLTGEAYNGNAFWDTETYCLPFFLFHDREAARNLLYFRYQTLDEARKRAKELDCEGAFYPIATISGRECCNLWQHASLQLQASTAVAYGIWLYEHVTGDDTFTTEFGFEMLIEISRMLASRGSYDSSHTHYGFYGVMGPDEFQMMVNHNAYTNYMGRFALNFCTEVYDRMQAEHPGEFFRVVKKLGLQESEYHTWKQIAEDMYIPYDKERQIYEQHEGFFHLPHVDIDKIPITDFPLYEHWTYDRIYRNDMIKQPDVLMFMLLLNTSFSLDEIKRNYDFYEPRCIHESSLSPSVHSILAEQLGREEEAFEFFRFATRMDLDNYNRNSGDGLHTTSIAAAWMNILFGFGGLRCDGPELQIAPKLPAAWKGYRFRFAYAGDVIEVTVKNQAIQVRTLKGHTVSLLIYDEETVVDGQVKKIQIP